MLAAGLLSLALWSWQMAARLPNDAGPLRMKAGFFLAYALLLAYLAYRWGPHPRRQAALLLSLALALMGGEFFTHLTNPPPEDPDYRQAAPYVMFAGQPGGRIEVDNIPLSPLGYRDDIPPAKAPGEYRIILLGGSAAFLGQPSIAQALQAELNGGGYPGARVYNWGVFSVVSGQELAAMLFRAVDYAPDMILVYNGSNDLTEPYFFDPRPGYPFDFMALEGGRRLIEGDWGLFDLYALLLRPSSLGYTLFQLEIQEQITGRSRLAARAGEGSEVWRAAIVEQYGQNLGKMCRLAGAFDFRLAVVLQPMIFFKDHLAGQEPNLLGPADYQAHTRQSYDLARAALTELGGAYATSPCQFFDGSTLLQTERAELFIDPVHITDEGNRIIAARLMALLTPLEGR
jgi:lysophospholipase L1-like esterase